MAITRNTILQHIQQLTTLPPLTLFLLAVTIFLSAITSYIRTQSYRILIENNSNLLFDEVIIPSLQLVPSHFFFHPWTLFTSSFVETSPFQFLIGLVIVYFGITFLESQWNPSSINSDSVDEISTYISSPSQYPISETWKFLYFVIIISNFFSLLIVSFIHVFNGTSEALNFPLQYGLFILVMPLSVVAKQLIPERNIRVLSFFKFRLKRLPFILLLLSLLLSVIRIRLSPALPAFVTFLTTWYYLRYIQVSPAMNSSILPTSTSSSNTPNRGDPSDTFSLVEFFPEFLKPALKPFLDGFYQISVLLGIVRPWNDDDIDIGNLRSNLRVSGNPKITSSQSSSTNNNPSINHNLSAAEIDERRKQIALKVLEQSTDK